MGFRTNAYARVWAIEDKGNYHEAQVSVSRKNKETEKYEQEWGNRFVRLIGEAHKKAANLQPQSSIKILDCDVKTRYVKEKEREYTSYMIYDFELQNGQAPTQKPKTKAKTKPAAEEDDELPF